MSMEKRLEEGIKAVLGNDVAVLFEDVKKNNGVTLRAVKIAVGNVQPCIYIDEALQAIENEDATIEEVVDWIIKKYNYAKSEISRVNGLMESINKDKILELVEYQMINRESNAEKLKEIPYTEVLDMACIYRCMLCEDMSFIITLPLMQKCNISFEELEEAARANTLKSVFEVKSVNSIMMPMPFLEDQDERRGLWVLSSKKIKYGASIIRYPEYLAELAEKLQSDLYILPSSIHEILAIAVDVIDKDSLAEIICNVNGTVDKEEILGYKVYRYSLETKELSIA